MNKYFNAGIMLINSKKQREARIDKEYLLHAKKGICYKIKISSISCVIIIRLICRCVIIVHRIRGI